MRTLGVAQQVGGLWVLARTEACLVLTEPPPGEVRGTAGQAALVESRRDDGGAWLRLVDPEATGLGPRKLDIALQDADGVGVWDGTLEVVVTDAPPGPFWSAKGVPFAAFVAHAAVAAADLVAVDQVLAALTRAVWNLAPARVRYEGSAGLVAGPGWVWIDEALRLIDGGPLAPRPVNCVDCAALVCTLASALGIELRFLDFDDDEDHTAPKPAHWVLGGDAGRPRYPFHRLTANAGRVWDACLGLEKTRPIAGMPVDEYRRKLFPDDRTVVSDHPLQSLIVGKLVRSRSVRVAEWVGRQFPRMRVRNVRLPIPGERVDVSIFTLAERLEIRVDRIHGTAESVGAIEKWWRRQASPTCHVARSGNIVTVVRRTGDPVGFDLATFLL